MIPLRRCLLAFLLLGVPLAAQARVGETRAEFEKRFGAGKEVGDQVLFVVGDFGATVFFDAQNRATMTIYSHRQDNDGQWPALTEADIETLLREEGQGQAWRKLTGTTFTTWQRADARLFGRHRKAEDKVLANEQPSPAVDVLIFVSSDYKPSAPDVVPASPRKGN